MKELLYFNSDQLQTDTSVLECTPTADGHFEVILAATLFHPQGGGQVSDTGTIANANVIRVTQVGGRIVHLTDRHLDAGNVTITVFPEPRHLHTRLHSAGHLIGCYGEMAGLRAVKAHHWPREAKVVFECTGSEKACAAEDFEQQINAWVEADLPRHISYEGEHRKIGFGDLTAYACGGTHVISTGIIGSIKILKLKDKKGQLSVHYDIANDV